MLAVQPLVLNEQVEQDGTSEGGHLTAPNDELPVFERPDPLVREDAADVAPRDSEVDFDDEQEEDQLPLDVVEAAEVGVLLDSEDLSQDE